MDPSSSGGLLRGPEMEVDPAAYDDGAGAGSSGGAENSPSASCGGGSEGSDVESMTGRGIKCLCSELLELKKSSDKDFQRNAYSNYSTFIRVFKEVGDVESELMELRRHVSDQKRLVKDLMENFCMDNFSENLLEVTVENDLKVGKHLLTKPQTHSISILEKLDIFSVERRFEDALDVLETENKTLQKIDREGYLISAENFASRRSALSELRIGLADQLAAMAEHPRVTAPELQRLLSLLCRLGESCRANSLLIQFYHSHLVNRTHELQCSKSLPSQVYLMKLAKTTFSVIYQAARSFVMLYGETSPYSSEFMVWVTEEIEMFTHYFDMYIKSIYEMNGGLHLAVESLKCAFSFCSLLESQRLVLHPYLIKSIRPCLKEMLQIHVDFLRKTIHIFVATDTWILDKFLVSEITRETSSFVGDRGKLEYFLLTNSGRMFVTSIQAILEDISPLCSLQMENSILRGLADLFNEYIRILECSIPSFRNSIERDPPRISSAQKLSQQLSLLVNTWTLVDYLFSVAKCIFERVKISSEEQISEDHEAPRHKELNSWIFSIQDAADQLRGFFCQQFVDRYISAAPSTRTGSETYMKSLGQATSSQAPMPSNEFQMFFQQLRQLERCGKSVFGGADEKVEKLLKDVVDAAVVTISNNIKFWRDSEYSSCIQQSIWFKQFVLDIHFLVEIARFGGYLSDGLVEASRSLVANVEKAFLNTDKDTSSAVTDDAWASAAAKAAIQKLVEIEATNLEPDEKHMNASEEGLNYESARASSEHDVTESVELSDREVETFTETDITEPQKIEQSGLNPLDGITIDFKAEVSDDEDSTSLSTAHIDTEDMSNPFSSETWINESEEIRQTETEFAGLTMTLEEDAACRQNGHAAYVNKLVIDGRRDTSDIEFVYNKHCKICTVQSMLTQGLATKSFANTAAKDPCLIGRGKSPRNLPYANNAFQDFVEKETMAVVHASNFSEFSGSAEILVDNYGKHAPSDENCSTELAGSPTNLSIEEDESALGKDPGMPKSKSRSLQSILDGELVSLPTNSAEQLHPAYPLNAVGSITEELPMFRELSSAGEVIASCPQIIQDAQQSGNGAKPAQRKFKPKQVEDGALML